MLCSTRRLLRDWEGPLSNRIRTGSVVQDKRDKVYRFFWWNNGKRESKVLGRFPTKAKAWAAAKPLRDELESHKRITAPHTLTVRTLVEHYRKEKMPTRTDTRRSYEVWIRGHILPKWGDSPLSETQARPVELWLHSLHLAPKSKAHIRGVLSVLWDFAMWRGDVLTQRNPMELVTVKGATKRKRQPRSLTVDEFRSFAENLEEPFRTIARLCVCLGLRISECLALKWSDVDWLNSKLRVERGIVCQNVDDVKSEESRKQLTIDRELLAALKAWKQAAQFSEDWMFASPYQLGRLPWSYDQVYRVYQKAAEAAGIGGFGTHTLRHTYRAWLDSVGTPVGVQQKLMRHTDVRTTMRYGDAFSSDMAQANGKIAGFALNGTENGTEGQSSN
jgi:integrase